MTLAPPPPRSVSVVSAGLTCGLGLTADAACAAIRARASRFEAVGFTDTFLEPVIGVPAREVVGEAVDEARLLPLAVAAVRECLDAGPKPRPGVPPKMPPLLLATDATHPPLDAPGFAERLLGRVADGLGLKLAPGSRLFTDGSASFWHALEEGRRLVRAGAAGVIVAAVDSLISKSTSYWLQCLDRLKNDDNSDGVIPGEAGAAVWLAPAPAPALLDVLGLGFGEEPSARDPERPNLATGLADAFRAALQDAGLAMADMDFRVGGMTGEASWFKEASTALARVQRVHKDRFELWCPAEKLGDAGAALPACMLVLTAVAMRKGYAPGGRGLLFGFSLAPERAACVVSRPAGVGRG